MLGIDALAAPEKCDALSGKLNWETLRALDEKRYEACLRIQQQKDRVVFLAERTDALEIFAEALSRRGHHANFVVGNQAKGNERAVKAVFGNGPDGVRRIKRGKVRRVLLPPWWEERPGGSGLGLPYLQDGGGHQPTVSRHACSSWCDVESQGTHPEIGANRPDRQPVWGRELPPC